MSFISTKKHIAGLKYFVLLIMCNLFVFTTMAQTVKLTLDMQNVTLKEALSAIEKQGGYYFTYNTAQIDPKQKVTIKVVQRSINETLDILFKGTAIRYKINDKNVVLYLADTTRKVTATRSVNGVIYDEKEQPIVGATVLIKGTTNGTSTGLNGEFTLTVNDNNVLQISYMGYVSKDIAVGSGTSFNISLEPSTVNLDEVVITAMGIKRSEKALSYNAQKIASEDILTVKDVNFVNALSGKVAGVNINTSSSGVGGAAKVVMRGTKSIEQSSNALYVVDGIPMMNFSAGGGTEFDSAGSTESIADINPEDIESMTVLTGASAAALYGSMAANGAIVITTKKGRAGRTSVTLTSNTELLMPFVMPEFQNRYGTGDLNSGVAVIDKSWGKLLNSANYKGYNPKNDYFQTGIVGTETVSFSTGTEKNQTYMSAGAVNSRGIIPNNQYDRYNFTIRNTSSFMDDRIQLDLGASYIMQSDLNMTNQGVYSNPLPSAYLFPRGNEWENVKMFERWDSERKIYTQYWPTGAGSFVMQNPYWINYRNLRENNKDRYMLHANMNYKILDWLNVSGRIRIDNSHTDLTEKFYASTNNQLTEMSDNGLFGMSRTKDKQVYGDALIDINKTFGDSFSIHANLGASFSDLRYDLMQVRGPIRDGSIDGEVTAIPNVFNIMSLSDKKTARIQEGWREQTQSIFGSVEFGFKNTYFVTVTGRNDWPSQLAGPNSTNKSFFYPSVGASIVMSQIVSMPENLSYLKLRGSYASVGNAFARFISNPKHAWNNSGKIYEENSQYPIYNLKPERTKSWEVGLTARFLKNFNLDVTYYDTKTYNQTFDPQISVGSGYSHLYIQSGSVLNRGVELSLGYKNTWQKFSWSSNYVFSTNHNKILELASKVINPISGEQIDITHLDMGGLGQTRFILRQGGTLGDIYSTADLKRDAYGRIFVDQNGEIATDASIKDVNRWIKLGSVLPKANMSFRNDFGFGNFSLGVMVSARLGGIVFSRTQAAMDYYGVSETSAIARDAGGVMINGGDIIDANRWFSTIGNQDGIPQYYTYSATNVRLQEASIGYTIPRSKLGGMVEITISAVGRNLLMIYNKAPFDPESVASTGNYYQGIDYFMMPSMRNIGFNVRLKF